MPAFTLATLQPEPMAALDAVIARARIVVDPDLLDLIEQVITHHVADGPSPRAPRNACEEDVLAVVEQGLLDVATMDDGLVREAARHFPEGGLADVVMASYACEARTRLQVAERCLAAR